MASVADLVEPEALRERAGEYLQRAGEALRDAGRVTVTAFAPANVRADVADGDAVRHVALSAGGDRLDVTCDCGQADATGLCPHVMAVAIETWHRAPTRR